MLLVASLLFLVAACDQRGSDEGARYSPPQARSTHATLTPVWTSIHANFLQPYCTRCHNSSGIAVTKSGDPTLDFNVQSNVESNSAHIISDLQTKDMPPPGSPGPFPSDAEIAIFEQWVNAGYPK
jgi:hypothetical protein